MLDYETDDKSVEKAEIKPDIQNNPDKNDSKNKKPINKKKIISEILVVLLISAVTFTILLSFQDLDDVWQEMQTANLSDLGIAIACLFLYMLIWPFSLCLISRAMHLRKHFLDAYLVGFTEHFFNGITPFSTGGQPIQVYLFTRRKITAANSTGLILTNFVAYMVATNAFAIAALFFYSSFARNFNGSTIWIVGLGFALNFFTLVFMILMATCKFIRNLLERFLLSLCKIKFIGKYLTKLVPIFDTYCINAQTASKEIFSHFWTFLGSILLRGISLAFYYAIPFFILRSLDVNLAWNVLPIIMLATAFAITTMVWVPTPGGTGGIEIAFTMIFTTFAGVTSSIASAGMVIWRGITYYLLMLISAISYILFEIKVKHDRKKEPKNEACPIDRQ